MQRVHHETVHLEQSFLYPVDVVFAAWADSDGLSRWYLPGSEGWTSQILNHDFSVGGGKRLTFGPSGEIPYAEDCRYEDIVQDERIIYTMTIYQADVRLTASLVTIEFDALGTSTNILMTDQMAIIDGMDTSDDRRKGWGEVFSKLNKELRKH